MVVPTAVSVEGSGRARPARLIPGLGNGPRLGAGKGGARCRVAKFLPGIIKVTDTKFRHLLLDHG